MAGLWAGLNLGQPEDLVPGHDSLKDSHNLGRRGRRVASSPIHLDPDIPLNQTDLVGAEGDVEQRTYSRVTNCPAHLQSGLYS